MRWKVERFKIEGDDGQPSIVSFEVKRGTRMDIAMYESLYATIGAALDEDSPVLVSDLRVYCKAVCFTRNLRHDDLRGVPVMGEQAPNVFVPPERTASLDTHQSALNTLMECDPMLTDRIAYAVDQRNRSLSQSYNPAEVGENLDESGEPTSNASPLSPVDTRAESLG